MRTPALIALASLLALPLTAGAEIYTWKDESGKTHYGDKPPLQKKITTRELKSGRTSGGDATSAAPASGGTGTTKHAEGNAPAGGDAAPPKSAEQLRLEAEARQKLCDNARTRLTQLESEKGILLTKNDKGESAPLVGDARKAKIESTRKEVDQWCK